LQSTSLLGFAQRALVASVLFVAVYGLARLSWMAVDTLLLLFIAVILGVALRGAARWVAGRLHTSKKVGFGITFFVVFVMPTVLSVAFAPALADQLEQVRASIPELREKVDGLLSKAEEEAETVTGTSLTDDGTAPKGKKGDEDSMTTRMVQQLNRSPSTQILTWVTGFVGGVGTAVGGFVLVIVVGSFLGAAPEQYVRGTLAMVPPAHRDRVSGMLDETAEKLQAWVRGQLVAVVVVGVFTGVGLFAIGMPLAFPLGVLAGLLDFIPNFGPVIAAVPAVLLASGEGKIAPVLGLYLVVQFLEGWILRPFIEKRVVDTPPALLLGAQVALASVTGLLGLLVAPALLVVLRVAVSRLYVEDVLGEDPPETDASSG